MPPITVAVAGLAMLSFAQKPGSIERPGTRSPQVLDVRDVPGVDCTGARDSSAALNALTGNVPASNDAITGKTLSFGGCANIQLAKTWLVKNQAGFIIDGMTRSGAGGKGVNVLWSGAVSGVMIDMEYVDGFEVRGFNIQGKAGAGVGIQIDKEGAAGTWNTTDGRLVNNTYQGSNQNWIGVSISPVSLSNVEDMRVEDSAFYCGASRSATNTVGIEVGASANVKNEIFRHNNFSLCQYGIYQKNGSMQVLESEFTSNGGPCSTGGGADIRIDTTSDVDIIDGNLDENGTQGINVNDDLPSGTSGGPSHPIIVRGNHAAPAGCENTKRYWYNAPSGPGYLFDGNSWDPDPNMTRVIGTNNPATATRVYTYGNVYPNKAFMPWWTTGNQTVSDDLRVMDDKLMVYGASTGHQPGANNQASPLLVFRGYFDASTSNPDDFVLQNIPGGHGNPTDHTSGGTFLIKHQQGVTGNEMFGWDGFYPEINIATIATPAPPVISTQGAKGSTSYSYAVLAYGPVGNTAGSATTATSTGAATLTSTNYNQIQWYSVAGATKYCIWRTSSRGAPSSTGNIGCTPAIQVRVPPDELAVLGYPTNANPFENYYLFNDTGLPGDSFRLPSSNTTGGLSLPGQITSTLPTGTPPLSIASTTPVSNLTLKNHPELYEAGVLTTNEKIYTNSQALVGGSATHTFANGFTFTSTRSFGCVCTDQTAANACRAVPASATAVTLAGTGSDILWLQCAGH